MPVQLAATQQDVHPQTAATLEALQASCKQQQDALAAGIQSLSERMARSGAVMRFVCRQRNATPAPVTTPVDGCLATGLRAHCTG